MAIGSAQVMGFKLMTNFNRPYFAKNVSEFWKRWHISLSTWFTDYLYISLGGNRVSVPRWYFNLFFVFLVSGLWHGANWTFIIWGGLNGLYLVSGIILKKFNHYHFENQILRSTYNLFNILVTFGLICISWVFFRANTAADAFAIISNFGKSGNVFFDTNVVYGFIGLLILFSAEYLREKRHINLLPFYSSNQIVRNLSYIITIVLIIALGVFDGGQFIYFQF